MVSHSRDWNLAREAVLGSKLSPSTPGTTLVQACGTSLQAAIMIGGKIATGASESGIAMGSDTTSDAPIVVKPKLAHRLVEVQTARSTMEQAQGLQGLLAVRAGAGGALDQRAAHRACRWASTPS